MKTQQIKLILEELKNIYILEHKYLELLNSCKDFEAVELDRLQLNQIDINNQLKNLLKNHGIIKIPGKKHSA